MAAAGGSHSGTPLLVQEGPERERRGWLPATETSPDSGIEPAEATAWLPATLGRVPGIVSTVSGRQFA